MTRPISAAAHALALMWLLLPEAAAIAQQTNQISIVYEAPKNLIDYLPTYQRLQERKVLETLQRFLSPLKLPRALAVKTAECGDLYMAYKSGGPVTICYEFVKLVESMQVPENQYGILGPALVTREMMLVGPIAEEVLHDVALGVFDMLDVPVWGRAGDAADYVASFLMLQFGTDVARKTVLGTAYFLNSLDNAIRKNAGLLRDVNYLGAIRPTVRQRYYNILCIAVGSDPVAFSTFMPLNRKPATTAVPADRSCDDASEYQQVKYAFEKTILEPFVDPDLLKQVRATQWLKDD
jgi:hypothetical protein